MQTWGKPTPTGNKHPLTYCQEAKAIYAVLFMFAHFNKSLHIFPFFAVKYKEMRGGLRLLISFLLSHTFSRHKIVHKLRKNCLSDITKTSYRKTHSKHHLPHTQLTKVSPSHTIMFTTTTTEKWAA